MPRTPATFSIAFVIAGGQLLFGQGIDDVRKLYDSGQYQQVIAAAARSDADPRVKYLQGQSHEKLSHASEARQVYGQLAGRPESDPWHYVGQSAMALMERDLAGALAAANRAIERDASLPEAYYQRGLAQNALQDMAGAAASFQKASDLDPSWAYPHYFAGVAYSKVKRIDLTAQHFQMFLRLAPQAPERGEVQSILKTLGR
jgi:tetratricopeptide (TPR) repeat protein